MTKEDTIYKGLDPACTATVRRLEGDGADAGRLRTLRRRGPLTRIAIDDSNPVPKGSAVRVEMVFSARGIAYRCLSLIEWTKKSGDPSRPHRLGIGIYSLDRLEVGEQPPHEDPTRAPTMALSPESLASKEVPPPAAVAPSSPEPGPGPKKAASLRSMPEAKEMGGTLTNLLGNEVNTSLAKTPIPSSDLFVVGTYISDSGAITALCGADIQLSVWLGAALGMLPVAEARRAITIRDLSEPIRENLQEILNILSTILNRPGNPHLKFGELLDLSRDVVPDAVRALIEQPVGRIDYGVEIPSYGSGGLCLLAAPQESSPEPQPPI